MTDEKPDLTTTSGKLADLRTRLSEAQAPLGESAAADSRAAGVITARERVLALVDPGSFVETDALARHRVEDKAMSRNRPATDGVVAGYGTVDGRRICVYAHDDQIFDGAIGEVNGEKILKVYDLATKTGVPVVAINAARGTRVIEGLAGLTMAARIANAATLASGIVPQIAVIAGDNTSTAAVNAQFADLTIQVEGTSVQVADADVIGKVTGTTPSAEELGGAHIHATKTGQAHLTAAGVVEAIELAREVIGYLPANNHAEAPRTGDPIIGNVNDSIGDRERALDGFMPDREEETYGVHDIITAIVDGGEFRELQPDFAANLVTGFARIESRAVGIVANQPEILAGCLDHAAATKAARFIRFCDAFNLPVITLVDSPGIVPSVDQEHAGISRALAQLTFAYAEATVGKLTVTTRKAIGPAFVALGAKDTGADFAYAWPTAQIAVADAPTATEALFGDDAAAHADAWAEANLTPYRAAESGLIDAVIEPHTTRVQLIEGLRLLDRKVVTRRPRKHDNIPLA